MNYQQTLSDEFLQPLRLKEGKGTCPVCHRGMRAYGYDLDEPMVKWLFEAVAWVKRNRDHEHAAFDPRTVFAGYTGRPYKKATVDLPSRAKFHGLVDRTRRAGKWYVTKLGYQFLGKKVALPSKVWTFNRQTILKEDNALYVDQVMPSWKTDYLHWVLDYVPVAYRGEIPASEIITQMRLL